MNVSSGAILPLLEGDSMKRAFLLSCLFALSFAPANRAQTEKTFPDQLHALFSSVTQPDAPGLAVLVRQDGRTLFEKGYGVRDLRSKVPIDARTDFRLASFTKQFTAMAIMLLVHDGKLRYDQTLPSVFPEFPAYGKNISIRNLLNHTGGLPDYEDLMDAAEKSQGRALWSPERQIQDDEVLALLEKASKAKFAPGTRWAYSNSGYVVLGLIVAKISGQPYRDFLRARIFAPLGMNRTIVYQKGKNEVPDRAFGYSKDGGTLKDADQSSTSATLGDGGIYSNLEDLAKWDDALRHHTLLTAAEMQPALTPATLKNGSPTLWPQAQASDDNLAPGRPVSYGFGWFLDPFRGHPRMWHTGGTSGFRTVIERFTADKLTIIILANRTDLDPKQLAESAAKFFPPLK